MNMSPSSEIVPLNTKFLVTTQPRYELDAASEIWHCLYVNGYPEDIYVHFVRKKDKAIAGLIAVVLNGDPIQAIQKIRGYLLRKPWILRYANKVIPIEFVTRSLDDLTAFVSSKANLRISESESWKIEISKRASKISSRKIIEHVANVVGVGKVSLENPQWLINIEIIRNIFLVSIIKPEWIIRKKEFSMIVKKKKLLEYI